jgi:hypothetical protein
LIKIQQKHIETVGKQPTPDTHQEPAPIEEQEADEEQ